MQYATIHISGNQAAATELKPITAGTAGAKVGLCFDASWEGFQKTLVWQGSGLTVTDLACTGIIPASVLTRPDSPLRVGVYGVKGEEVLPTVWAELGIVLPAASAEADQAADPALPVWAQLQGEIARLQAELAILQTQMPDMQNYVTKDYYYDKSKPGLMTIAMYDNGGGGLIHTNPETIPGGVIIARATNADIDDRSQKYKPIVPANLDYAVKSALTKNALKLSTAEKAAVKAWLGL